MPLSRQLLLTLVIIGSLMLPAGSVLAKRDVDSTDRLGLLNTATGNESSAPSGSYQERLDGILGQTSASPERSVVAKEDAQAREEAMQAQLLEEAAFVSAPAPVANSNLMQGNKVTENRITPEPFTNKVAADETTYQKEFEKALESSSENQAEETPGGFQENIEDRKTPSKLPPSLANNPFYFGPVEETSFEDEKPLIISRIIQASNGTVTESEARNFVQNATNRDEVILYLMQNAGFEYGQALEIAGTEAS